MSIRYRALFNRLLRVFLLAVTGFVILLYVLGLTANVFHLLEMRRSDEKLLEHLQTSGGARAFVTRIGYRDGEMSYAGMRGQAGADSVAVFFVHGSPGSLDAFSDYLTDPRLQSLATLVSYDRPGYGNSQPARADLSLTAQSEQLFALARFFDRRHNVFVGHSLGCSIIARLAIDHPEMVDGMVMISAPLDPALEPSSWWRSILTWPKIRIAMPRAFRVSNRELWSLKKHLEECLPLWDRIHCPVTFVHGDIDRLVPVENVAFGKRVLTKSEKVSEMILREKGHFILWTEEELIVEEVRKMVRD